MRQARALVCAVLSLCAAAPAALAHEQRAAAPAAGSPRLQLRTTAQLADEPEVAALLDELARQHRLEEPAPGAAVTPGLAELLTAQLAARVPRSQFLRFKYHRSVIVRASVLRHVVRAWPDSVDELYPLLADFGRVSLWQGQSCIGIPQPIPELLLTELGRRRDQPQVLALLRRAAADARLGWVQRKAQELLAADGKAPAGIKPGALRAGRRWRPRCRSACRRSW